MSLTVMKIGLLRLLNNPLELALTFVVPILFFSIFALIFGRGIGRNRGVALEVAVIDEDDSQASEEFQDLLQATEGVKIVPTGDENDPGAPVSRAAVQELVRLGRIDAAVVIPAGFGEQVSTTEDVAELEVLNDSSDPIATTMLSVLLRQTVGAVRGRRQARRARGLGDVLQLRLRAARGEVILDDGQTPKVEIREIDVLGERSANPTVAMYAAGISVMFLLFSAANFGGSLLEEQEAGTLERLLSSRLSLGGLLFGKWLFLMCIGSLQIFVMLAWAQLVFQVDVSRHLGGVILMSLATVAASASLGLFLAALCRTRAQLQAIGLTTVLVMSALGGSMVPRYLMSDELQRIGQYTFNAWAIDGFVKLLWRDEPASHVLREAGVLAVMAVAIGVLALILARRWQAD